MTAASVTSCAAELVSMAPPPSGETVAQSKDKSCSKNESSDKCEG